MCTFINDNASGTKTYSTRANLEKALAKAGLAEVGGKMIVWTEAGRCTCVFGKSFLEQAGIPLFGVASQGFAVLG